MAHRAGDDGALGRARAARGVGVVAAGVRGRAALRRVLNAVDLDHAAALLRDAGALLVCAGAGMGVDSGLPDFRGPEGFWRAYPPYRSLGLRFEELADPVHFADDPELAWGFYGHRLALYRATVPHPGFAVLHRWAAARPTFVLTSNVDGQFQAAGFDPATVAEVHGSIHHLQCLRRCGPPWTADGTDVAVDPATMRAHAPLPSCPRCGALARPNIFMFNDVEWDDAVAAPRLAACAAFVRAHRDDLAVVELGAGTVVPTIRLRAEAASASTGALVRINVREPRVRRGVGLAVGAAEALAALDARFSAPAAPPSPPPP